MRTGEEAIAWLRTERANLHACIDYATSHGRVTHGVGVLFAISDFLHNQGHWNEAVTLGQAALAAACTAGDRPGQAWALTELGMMQERTGNYQAAALSLGRALQLFGDLGDRHCQAVVLRHLGMVRRRTGDHKAAAASLTQALRMYRDLGDRHGQAAASINLGELLSQSSGRDDDALGYFAQALSIADDIGAPVLQARALEGIGRCYVRDGNPGQGTAHLRQALAIYQSIGAPEAQHVETTLLEQEMITINGGTSSPR